ncbi:P-loop containing nucleoside triphosphate hydrolase protein [Phlyctochytrium arcticum]|nr:P-loop containing nucleoside triphosphate hydrolase protein [Phlyctochytrium arcticum]
MLGGLVSSLPATIPTRKRTRNALNDDDDDSSASPPKRSLRPRLSPGKVATPPKVTIAGRRTRTPLTTSNGPDEKRAETAAIASKTTNTDAKVPTPNIPTSPLRSAPATENVSAVGPQTPRKTINDSTRFASSPRTPRTPRTPSSSLFQDAKSLFRRNGASTHRLVGRTQERATIIKFWETHVIAGKAVGASLYISGCPGTGKTALVDEICADFERRKVYDKLSHKVYVTKINCMVIKDPKKIYAKILAEIRLQLGEESSSGRNDVQALECIFLPSARPSKSAQKHPVFVVVLDEIDSLLTRDQDILYKLFSWPFQNGTRLVLIGIANALDLTDRFLPRLKAQNCEPLLLNFNPYEVNEISEIIKDRLLCLAESKRAPAPGSPLVNTSRSKQAENQDSSPFVVAKGAASTGAPLIHPMAVELCARKMAGTGDLRKALDVCRHAIELVEAESRSAPISNTATPSSPRRALAVSNTVPMSPRPTSLTDPAKPQMVTVKHILAATKAMLGAPNTNRLQGLNVHMKMVLCTLVVMGRDGGAGKKGKDMSLGKVYESYTKQCKSGRTPLIPVTKSELQDLITGLETAGLITVGGKASDSMVVSLSVRPEEVESAVADTRVLADVLKVPGRITSITGRGDLP